MTAPLTPPASGTPSIHDQIIRCVEQAGHPDWSLREMVNRLKEIAKEARQAESRAASNEKDARRYHRALDRAAYALFQIKRMVPEAIPEFAAKAHEITCRELDVEHTALSAGVDDGKG